MKAVFLALVLCLFLSCEESIPVAPGTQKVSGRVIGFNSVSFDAKDALYPILGYRLSFSPPVSPFMRRSVSCFSTITGLCKSVVSRLNGNTLRFQIIYIGVCPNVPSNQDFNDFEIVVDAIAPAPVSLGDYPIRISFEGTCIRMRPVDGLVLNQKVKGYALLSSTTGEFFVELPFTPSEFVSSNMGSKTYTF